MRIQSKHSDADRGLDAYFSPNEAVVSLLNIEKKYLPKLIWEPAAGDGAIVKPFREAGYQVIASDIADYGLDDCEELDYLNETLIPTGWARKSSIHKNCGVVTNPPYKFAVQFAERALTEVSYVAFLLRTNFLESTSRLPFFRKNRPARIWISSRRLPMMHRRGWTGPTSTSNTCFAWFVWDNTTERDQCSVDWFDFKDFV